jgi:hypothetical protein
MKTRLVLLGLLLIAAMALIPGIAGIASATNVSATWTGDLNVNDLNINGTLNTSTYLETFYFPMTLEQINQTGDLNVTVKAGSDPTTVILTFNGVQTYSGTLSANLIGYTNMSMLVSNSVPLNVNYLTINVTVTANETVWTNLTVTADDATLSGGNFSYSVSETNLSTPSVEYYDTDSFYTVRDTVSVTQNSDFNLTNVTATFTYPSNAISQDISSYNYGDLNSSSSKSQYVAYQKRGPYVTDLDNYQNGNYVTNITIYSPEGVSAVMVFDPTEKPWSKDFPSFSKSGIIDIELNGRDVDWEDPPGTIEMSLSLSQGYNYMNITYSGVAPAAYYALELPPTPWYEQEFLYIPVWIWLVVVVALVLMAVYYGVILK